MVRMDKERILGLYGIKDSGRTSSLIEWMLRLWPQAGIDANAFRTASYLAQVGHESGRLRYLEEIASGKAYEGRTDLGNVRRGDGVRYKGRGLIMVTGRYNYQRCGEWLGIDLESQPQLLSEPEWAVKSSLWFWDVHDLNAYADNDDLRGQTKVINGGYNGYEDRQQLYVRALRILGQW